MTPKRTILIGVGALVATAVVAGCDSSGDQHAATQAESSPTASTAATAAEAHNAADVMFAQHMIPHHQQAIEMSDILLAKDDVDPRITELATQIKAAQGPEIEQMRGWLRQWGIPSMPAMPSGDMGMPGHGDMPGHGGNPAMPDGQGMMSEADMTALKNADGAEAGRLFLTQMIAHHQGAIEMAQTEISDGQYPAAVAMARSIVTTQQQEIDTMKSILG